MVHGIDLVNAFKSFRCIFFGVSAFQRDGVFFAAYRFQKFALGQLGQ